MPRIISTCSEQIVCTKTHLQDSESNTPLFLKKSPLVFIGLSDYRTKTSLNKTIQIHNMLELKILETYMVYTANLSERLNVKRDSEILLEDIYSYLLIQN